MTLSQSHASLIADKLDAQRKDKRNHEVVYIRDPDGRLIGRYGIQRSSKPKAHDYIPRQINVTTRQALDLANCPMSKEQYFDLMRSQGLVPALPSP